MDLSNREELISAYLDGELDAQQREHIERLLAEDDSAARLLDEFRALRTSLRALPAANLEDGFSHHILQQAIQAADADTNNDPPMVAPAARLSSDTAGSGRDLRRHFLWSALAIAAAVLLMLYHNPEPTSELARDEPSTGNSAPRQPENASADQGERAMPQMSAASEAASDETTSNNVAESSPAPFDVADDFSESKFAEGGTSAGTAPRGTAARNLRDKKDGVEREIARAASPQRGMLKSTKNAPGAPAPEGQAASGQIAEYAARRKDSLALQPETVADEGVTVYTYAVMNQIDALSAQRFVDSRLGAATQPTASPPAAERPFADGDELQNRARVASTNGAARKMSKRQTGSAIEHIYELEGTQQQIDNSLSQLESSGVFQLVSVALRTGSLPNKTARPSVGKGFGGGGDPAEVGKQTDDAGASFGQRASSIDRQDKEAKLSDVEDQAPRAVHADPLAQESAEVDSAAATEKLTGGKSKPDRAAKDESDTVGLTLEVNPDGNAVQGATQDTAEGAAQDTVPGAVQSDNPDASGPVPGVALRPLQAKVKSFDKNNRIDAEQQDVRRVLIVFRVIDTAAATAARKEAIDNAAASQSPADAAESQPPTDSTEIRD